MMTGEQRNIKLEQHYREVALKRQATLAEQLYIANNERLHPEEAWEEAGLFLTFIEKKLGAKND